MSRFRPETSFVLRRGALVSATPTNVATRSLARRATLMRLPFTLVLVATLLASCGQVPELEELVQEPKDAASARLDFEGYLQGYGQRFDPAPEPVDAPDWHPAVQGFPTVTAKVSRAVFGNVTCVDPSMNCANRGLARPGEIVPIWLITFTDPGNGWNAACSPARRN